MILDLQTKKELIYKLSENQKYFDSLAEYLRIFL